MKSILPIKKYAFKWVFREFTTVSIPVSCFLHLVSVSLHLPTMNLYRLAEDLFQKQIISGDSYKNISSHLDKKLFSLNFELKSFFYVGVLILAGGLGIAVYKNIDSIGHLAVILFIAAVTVSGFTWCFKKSKPYAPEKTESPGMVFDYVLLLSSLTFVTLIGYLQFQYSVFGSYNSLALLIPALALFFAAYYFDHLGVLSVAITCLAGFAGISISPYDLIRSNNFREASFIYTGIILGLFLVAAGYFISSRGIKSHFLFTWLNFAAHLLFVSCVAGIFMVTIPLFTLLLAAFVFAGMKYARSTNSFYIHLITVLYGFVGFTYAVFYLLFQVIDFWVFYLALIYLILSSIYFIRYLRNEWKKFKSNAAV